MYKPNHSHYQQSLMDSSQWMNPKIRDKLEKSWAPIFYEHVFCNIDEEPFAILYGTTGKPNFPVNIMLSLEYIKHMKASNDLELLDDFYFDYLVNYAVGIRTLGELNLSERTLYLFRRRLYRYCIDNPGKETLLFGQFVNLLQVFAKEAGISMSDQRVDTTMFMSNIKKAGRLSLAYDILTKTVKAIPEASRPQALAEVLTQGFKTTVLYRSKPQDGESRLAQLLNLCKDALQLLEASPSLKGSDVARLARRFLEEQSTPDATGAKIEPKPNKEIKPGSLQSAFDEGATYRNKGGIKQSGYVLELSETCGEGNDVQLITDYTVKPNNIGDASILPGRLPTIRGNTGCTDMYLDGGFHSEGVRQAAADNGIEVHLTNMNGKEPSKKLSLERFEIDGAANIILKCPGGYAPIRAAVKSGQMTAHFPNDACSNCEYFSICHSKKQVKDYVVRISLKALTACRERAAIKAGIKENTSKRAGIEGSNSALKRKGLNKLKVRGKEKCDITCGLIVTVQNIKRFIKFMQGGYKQKNQNIPPNRIPMPKYC